MTAIKLTDTEQLLCNKIRTLLDTLREHCKDPSKRLHEKVVEDYEELGKLAHQLHKKLASRGFEPLHHQYMYENRGVPTSDPNFYTHIHPTEDLLKYITNPAANADAPDLTVDMEFKLRVYTNRWGHDDIYTLKRTHKGWYIAAATISGKSKKSGYPVLFKNLKHDSVSYPIDLKYYIEGIWEKARDGATHEEIQKEFDRISQWLRVCEQNSPDPRNQHALPFEKTVVGWQGYEGAITFMDVLGWKGIWNRDDRAMEKLEELRKLLVSQANGEALENTKRNCDFKESSFRGLATKVLLISDTLVIATFGNPAPTLWLHGELTAQIICESLKRGIPLRGATCFGRFDISERESVFLGPAVDEAAEWHEQLDWIGVVQTPTAMLSEKPSKTDGSPPWIMYQQPPIKGGKVAQLMASNWPSRWNVDKEGARDSLTKALKRLGPISPNIAPKIFASLNFYDKLSAK